MTINVLDLIIGSYNDSIYLTSLQKPGHPQLWVVHVLLQLWIFKASSPPLLSVRLLMLLVFSIFGCGVNVSLSISGASSWRLLVWVVKMMSLNITGIQFNS